MRNLLDMILRAPDGIEGGAPAAPVVALAVPVVETAPVTAPAVTLLGGDAPVIDPNKPAAEPVKVEAPAEYVADPALSEADNAAKKAEFDAAKTEVDKAKLEADKPMDPAGYKIELREGEALDPEIDKEFRDYAAGKKLSQEEVDKLTGFQRKVMERQAANLAANVESWGKDLRADKEIGGKDFDLNCSFAVKARDAFFPPEMKEVFNSTGLGNYPAFVKGMVRIGKAMSEAGIVPGGATAQSESKVSILYGSD